jgi:hypothetical protein
LNSLAESGHPSYGGVHLPVWINGIVIQGREILSQCAWRATRIDGIDEITNNSQREQQREPLAKAA